MSNFEEEAEKSRYALYDEIIKYEDKYKFEGWAIIYGCIEYVCYELKPEGGTLEDIIKHVEEFAFEKWGEAANVMLENIGGLKTTHDIKVMWDSFTKAGYLVDDGIDEQVENRNLCEGMFDKGTNDA